MEMNFNNEYMQFKFDPTQFEMRTQPKPTRRRKVPNQSQEEGKDEAGPSREKKIRLIWPDSGSENSRSNGPDSIEDEFDEKNKVWL